MRGRSALCIVALSLLLGVWPALASHEVNRWNLVTANDFTQGSVRTSCPGQIPCQQDEFSIGGSSFAECFSSQDTVPRGCVGQIFSETGWDASGLSGYNPLAGDTSVETFTAVDGQRLSRSVFEVSVQIFVAFEGSGPSEVAVIRYAGDPNDFEGVEADSVAELIGLGLIGAGDVLAVESGILADVDFQADVTGVPEDKTKAAKWFTKAAEQGDAMSQSMLASMYMNGDGVPKDGARAVEWYTTAARQGSVPAQMALGGMYGLGRGVPKSYVTAYAWTNIAEASGEASSTEVKNYLAARMTDEQIAEAQALSAKWHAEIEARKKADQ